MIKKILWLKKFWMILIASSSGLVGYDDRLTRDRSRVRFSVRVFYSVFFLIYKIIFKIFFQK